MDDFLTTDEFNYCIGRYWEGNDGAIAVYMTYGREVKYGDLNTARESLEYVKRQSPEGDWKIFELLEIE